MQIDAFMATAAQVIPTLGIALAIEVGSTLRSALSKYRANDFEAVKAATAGYVTGMGINLAAGEIAALSVLLFQIRGWLGDTLLALTGISILYGLAGMVIVPATQIRAASKAPRPRRVRTRARRF